MKVEQKEGARIMISMSKAKAGSVGGKGQLMDGEVQRAGADVGEIYIYMPTTCMSSHV